LIDTIIFDVDGTLLDSVDQHTRAWQLAFKKFGFDRKFYEIRRQIGKGGDKLMPAMITKAQVREFGEEMEEERGRIFKRNYLPKLRPFEGVRDLFIKLREEGKTIALASSAPADELRKYKVICKIEDLVEDDASGDDASSSKPAPDIFLAAIEKLGKVNKKRIVAVGDTPYDAESATAAGIKAIGVLTGGWTKSELESAGCSEVYTDVKDMLEQFESSILK
jgi:HAD superfamily hydrolase (TIGR01509 family)